MKSTGLRLAIASLALWPYAPAVAVKCSPTGVCTACKNCTGCANCAKHGGTCSVCRGVSEAESSTPDHGTPQILFAGKVVGVSDGDTISVMNKGKEEKVRLYGVDAPEKGQPYGENAKQLTSSLVFGETVQVRVVDTDQYGRSVGVVLLASGNATLNVQLVRAGLAWHYKQYAPNDTYLAEEESSARAARRGLWADKSPIAPWAWRKARKR